MRAHGYSSIGGLVALSAWLLVTSFLQESATAASPGQSIIPVLQEQFGLSERQVRGALGALLIFVREELPKQEFDDLARTIPNAERIMAEVKLQGVVTRPLDDLGDYEAALSSLGIGQPLASRFAPAVVQFLGASGHTRERDILVQALD